MAHNSIYKNQMASLYRAALAAEEKYRKYLEHQYSLQTVLPADKLKSLRKCLETILSPNVGDVGHMFRQQRIGYLLNHNNINAATNVIVNTITTGPRLDRTLSLLGKKIVNNVVQNKKNQPIQLTGNDIAKIIGNVKEYHFKVSGEKQVNRYNRRGLIASKMILKDIDDKKMDFLIQEDGINTEYSKPNKYGFQYIINGVPLEYKSGFSPMHLTDKYITSTNLRATTDSLILHHMTLDNSYDKMIEDLEMDVCRMVIIDKIQQGFPVFITSMGGTTGKDFLLCSEMLQNLNTIQGMKTKMLQLSQTTTGLEDLKQNFTLEDIKKAIKKDADIRAQAEHEMSNRQERAFMEGETADVSDIETELAGLSILKSLMGHSVKTSLWYSK